MINPVQPSLDLIRETALRLRGHLSATPLVVAPTINTAVGRGCLLKLESMQPTGSFKVRGAFSALLRWNRKDGPVVTASTGNHGAAVAYAARELGLGALIVVPERTPNRKLDNVARLDAELIVHGDSYDDADRYARDLARDRGLRYVSAFCDRDVIAGQGTAALELLEQAGSVDMVVVPVGGGGLISGIATAIKGLSPTTRVIGVQPDASRPMYESMKAGRMVDVVHRPTLSEGTAGGIAEETLDIALRLVDEVVTVSELEIGGAMRYLLLEERLVVEGAGALTTAAFLAGKIPESGSDGRTVLVVSGRNVDADVIRRVMAEGGPGL